MNYKFQVGDLVRVKHSHPALSGSLALVIGRGHTPFQMDEFYTVLFSDGESVDAIPHYLRKVNK